MRTADTTITEITCPARGIRHCVPDARTIVIVLVARTASSFDCRRTAGVADFVMNNRCAAGTGRFLELLAAQASARRFASWNRSSPAVTPRPS